MPAHDVASLIEDATQDIAAQIATEVVIIEDEPLIAMDLKEVVQALGHRVVGGQHRTRGYRSCHADAARSRAG
jgi:hypothetical protein